MKKCDIVQCFDEIIFKDYDGREEIINLISEMMDSLCDQCGLNGDEKYVFYKKHGLYYVTTRGKKKGE